ncbi:hypothetical protein [Flavobacterium sp. KACC 22761]|uniref:hypothetical protein n=1 Tax=Flavobacterium sp. KACC 22761 TaxID=3092665 RepID=UPI002A74EF6A|nr:hypothetical protein [Flavobacterium sp. KACC 22761]WPO77979.1 hypothetical protein SCB73_17055 [Flavobacterium sp. KACC 22761]
MIKKIVTPVNVIFLFWGLVLLTFSESYPQYTRYYLYMSILVILPIIIFDMMKQRKQDKQNGTAKFQSAIFRMFIMAILLVIAYLVTRQNYL